MNQTIKSIVITTIAFSLLAMTITHNPTHVYAASTTNYDFSAPADYSISNPADINLLAGLASLSSEANFVANDIALDTGNSSGAVMGDVNGDGHLDIYVADSGDQNKLWLGDSLGNFTASDISGDTGSSNDATMGYVNNDEYLDIYVANFGQNKLWLSDGSGNGGASFNLSNIFGDTGNSQGAVMGYVNNDEYLDIYVASDSNQQNKLWLGDGLGNFTASDISGDTGNSTTAIMGYVNNDEYLDIYVTNFNQQNKLWINDGLGNFTASDISGDTGNSSGAVIGDVNGDGYLDIYVANNTGEQNKLWINDGSGNGGASFELSNIFGDTGNSYSATMGDVNNDGHLDIYVTNFFEQNKLWINDGLGNFIANNITGDLGFSYSSTMGDVNNDGNLDIYVTNLFEQNKLWINTPTYPSTSPYLEPTTAESFPLTIQSFSETLGSNNQGTITYQISTDNGTSFNYWNGTAWTATTQTDGTETSPVADINTNIPTLDTDGGEFLFRAYLNSDSIQNVELDQIDVSFEEVVPEPTRSKSRKRISQSRVAELFARAQNSEPVETTQEQEIASQPISTESQPSNNTLCPAPLQITQNLRNGNRNSQVNLLQFHMNRILTDEYGSLASGPIDGVFGPLTKRAVERLQNRLNERSPSMTPLVIDGIVGPFTRNAINNSCSDGMFVN